MDGPSERVRRGSSHEALLALMSNRLPGETPMSFIRSELGLTASAAKDLRACSATTATTSRGLWLTSGCAT